MILFVATYALTDGRVFSRNSLLGIGACACAIKSHLGTQTLDTSVYAWHGEMAPVGTEIDLLASAQALDERRRLLLEGGDARVVMAEFGTWLRKLGKLFDAEVWMAAWPAQFHGGWIDQYFRLHTDMDNPFEGSLCLRTLSLIQAGHVEHRYNRDRHPLARAAESGSLCQRLVCGHTHKESI